MSLEVVIITYPGGERYLNETVESFRAQGVEPRVVNDERETWEKWNEAIDLCQSDYIALAHHDDVYLPTFVGEMTAYLDAHPDVIAAFCLDYHIDKDGKRIGQTMPLYAPKDSYSFRDVFEGTLKYGNMLRCETVVLRKALLGDLRYPDHSLCGRAHDTQFWFQLLDKANVGIVPKHLVKYRIHDSSDTQRNVAGNPKGTLEHLRALEFAAALRPLEVEFSERISIEKGIRQALDQLDSDRVRAQAMTPGARCEFLVCHEPPDAAGTGVVVAHKVRQRNTEGESLVTYYVYPKDLETAELGWEKGCPTIAAHPDAFMDLVDIFKPERIEYHHLLRWPLTILNAPCPEKELYFHDSYLWCARYHSFNDKGEVCNEPEITKCAPCAAQTVDDLRKKREILAELVPKCTRLVANSAYTKQYADLYFGIDCEIEEPCGSPLYPTPKRKKLGYFGGFYPVKGVQVLLKAMSVLPDVQLLMFCDVPAEWLDGRKMLGYDNVLVMGSYHRGNLPDLVHLVDCAVVPSINESFGLVKRELERLGATVIASSAGALGGNVAPNNPEALVDAIKAAL